MMDGYDMGSGGWIMMILFWTVLLAVIVWAVRYVPRGRGATGTRPPEQAREILDARLARGEIDTETYDRLRAKLGGDDTNR